MRNSFVPLLSTFIFFAACTTSAKDAKYAADDAHLEKTHAQMQQRLDPRLRSSHCSSRR